MPAHGPLTTLVGAMATTVACACVSCVCGVTTAAPTVSVTCPRVPSARVKMTVIVALAIGSPCSVPTQFAVNAAEIAAQVTCSPGFAFTVVGTNITGSVPTAGAGGPAGSAMLLIVIVPEPVLLYVPVAPAP